MQCCYERKLEKLKNRNAESMCRRYKNDCSMQIEMGMRDKIDQDEKNQLMKKLLIPMRN